VTTRDATETTTATATATDASVTTPTSKSPRAATATPTATPTPSPSDLPVSRTDTVGRGVPVGPGLSVSGGSPAHAFVVGGTDWVDSDHHAHQVWFWNESESTWTGTVAVRVPAGSLTRQSVDVPVGSAVAFVFRVPAAYTVVLAGAGANDAAVRAAVDPAQFDCNESATDVIFDADGVDDRTTVSTSLACPG
jgi:hypothetical protein